MFSVITGRSAFTSAGVCAAVAALALGAFACDKVPLLAPSASTITLSSNITTVQANGVAEIRAMVLESSGTPVQNGTTVTFTTTLGAVAPVDARTVNGVATTQFIGNGQSGEAIIRATSGAAKPAEGQTTGLTLKVGGAAASKVTVNANPTTVPALGGSSTIIANVVDAAGNPLSGVGITFSTTAGSLSTNVSTSDGSGNARTTLTTNRDATVTAAVGANTATVSITAAPRPTILLAASGNSTVGGITTFTITATTAAGGVPIESITIDYGDGDSEPLGTTSTTAQHVYDEPGSYTVTATVRDATGQTSTAVTPIVVVQPVIIGISYSKSGNTATFTAVVTPAGTPVATYTWSYGDGSSETATTNTVTHDYVPNATYTVRLTVTTTSSQTASNQATITIP
jgi:PKD repeat protein/plastocyanin